MNGPTFTTLAAVVGLTVPLQAQAPPDTAGRPRTASAGVIAAPCAVAPWTGDSAAVDAAYVPRDLNDAVATLRRLLPAETLAALAADTEADVVRYHHGLGTRLRNCWGLWAGSRLTKYFNRLGIAHPDDMSAIILRSLYRQLHDQPIDLPALLARYPSR